ncbi:MAG: hypothetical protein WBA59_12325 [Moheibacter sp.]
MARFEKGNTHGKGRPKGSKNRTNEKIRNAFLKFVSNNVDEMQESFDLLEPKERFRVLLDVTKFILPTLKSIEYGNVLDELSEEDFQTLIEKLKEEYSMN